MKTKILTLALTALIIQLPFGVVQAEEGHDHHEGQGMHQEMSHAESASEENMEAAVYTCPMHPKVRQSEPGKCPICGMFLEKVTADTDKVEAESEPNEMMSHHDEGGDSHMEGHAHN